MAKIILISGKAEAGKTTAANFIKSFLEKEGKKVCITPYGAYVKDTARMLFGWDGVKNEKGRKLLQTWGTDIVRAKSPNFWTETVIRLAYILKDDYDYIIVDDCRFPDEIECWRNRGYDDFITLRIERPGHTNALTPEQRQHQSETALDNYDFDKTISSYFYTELRDKAEDFAKCLIAERGE